MSSGSSLSHSEVLTLVLNELMELTRKAVGEFEDPRLDEYRRKIEKGEYFPLIVRMDPRIEDGKRPDIELFGGRIIVEVKTSASQFGDGEKQVEGYVKSYPRARFAIITDHQSWRLFDVENGQLLRPWKPASLDEIKLTVEKVLAEGISITPSPKNIESLFSSVLVFEEELREVFDAYKVGEGGLFKAYKNIMMRLYEKAPPETVRDLFIEHTIMQMIVLACLTACLGVPASPEEACAGTRTEVGLASPYLNWWHSLLEQAEAQDKKLISSLTSSIFSKALLLDWKNGREEDVFRELYEVLIDPSVRRQIGEYYTPLWLVEYVIERVSKKLGGLRGRIVLDPFCGSGTFLVMAFYHKVREGAPPDEAIREVVGFDVNPLAVSIARAELMIAYQNEAKKGALTPLIFNSDLMTTALTMGNREKGPVSFIGEMRPIEKKLLEKIGSPLVLSASPVSISDLLELEAILCSVFRLARASEDMVGTLREEIGKIRCEPGSLKEALLKVLRQDEIINVLAELIREYGDSVWATAITSLFAPFAIYSVKADVIMSNPPWMTLAEVKGRYGQAIRMRARAILKNKNYRKKGQILNASDISSVFLHICLNVTKEIVAFVMPNEAVYKPDALYGLGKVLTYEVIKGLKAETIFINHDVFRHGRFPALLLVAR